MPRSFAVQDDLRAVGIVEIENRRLRERIGGTGEARDVRISLELGGASVVGRGDERKRPAAARHRGRVVQRFARDLPLDALGVGHAVQERAAAAGEAEPGQRDRRAHELHEAAAGKFVALQLRCALRKFLRQLRAEFGRVGEFLEAAPVFATGGGFGGMFEDAFHFPPPLS